MKPRGFIVIYSAHMLATVFLYIQFREYSQIMVCTLDDVVYQC